MNTQPASNTPALSRFAKISPAGTELPESATEWVAVLDRTTGLMWSAEDAVDADIRHTEAEGVCQSLTLAGFTDWNAPTRAQLATLIDDTRHSPAIDTAFFPNCKNDWYWTRTPAAWAPGARWIVGFHLGSSDDNDYHRARVRAVRSVPVALSGQ